MRFKIYTYNDDKKPIASLPWLWAAHLVAYLFRDEWIEGKVVDSRTGKTRITWELSGNVFGDGRAHLTVLRGDDN